MTRIRSGAAIDALYSHKSVRNFLPDPIGGDALDAIVQSAFRSSTSHYQQAISVIRITDRNKREELGRLSWATSAMTTAPEVLIYCLDFRRLRTLVPELQADDPLALIFGLYDAGLMVQASLVAAESLGIKGVMIGAFLANVRDVGALLDLPYLTIPLVCLCLGFPKEVKEQKPRLKLDTVYATDSLPPVDEAALIEFNEEVLRHYSGKRDWTHVLTQQVAHLGGQQTMDYFRQQGFYGGGVVE